MTDLSTARGLAEAQAAFGHRPSAFVLEHGLTAPVTTLPSELESGPLGRCYENAGRIALDRPDRFVYCEGFAVRVALPIPVEHAWLYDLEQRAFVDPTWPETNGDYFGVPFKVEYLAETVTRRKVWGLIGVGEAVPNEAVKVEF